MTYLFPQFPDVVMTNAQLVSVNVNYTIGLPNALIIANITSDAGEYGVLIIGFNNTEDWGDQDVLDYVTDEICKYEIE